MNRSPEPCSASPPSGRPRRSSERRRAAPLASGARNGQGGGVARKGTKKDAPPEAERGEPAGGAGGAELLDRDLSWLDFNARVLALAEDPAVPLLERLKFLAIFSANLDEFFMVRVAGLAGRAAAGLGAVATGGLEPEEQLKAIRARVLELVADQTAIFAALPPALAEAGIRLGGPDGIEPAHRKELGRRFEMQLRQRRFGRAVRLEVDAGMPAAVRELLLRELQLGADDLYEIDGLLDLGSLSELYAVNRPELKYPAWVPVRPAALGADPGDIFAALRHRDVLVHHPYESFSAVEAFIDQAAGDPDVLAIKQTMYRTSLESAIPRALIRAAEAGKQVAVLVELTARFSEEVNVAWAHRLEEAGVHVVYGLVGLKTGCKATLVVRRDRGELRRYCHFGTGNYDPTTARQYEDVGLLTADEDIGADLSDLFNFLTGYSRRCDYRKLVVAPTQLRSRILELIRDTAAEAGGRMAMKMNNLVDEEVIEALYRASAAGCEIDLIIRGICRLRPGVPGRSERIRVRSIVGRYLEHSRIFAFGPAGEPTRYFIGSADLTPSNLDRRVQLLCPVEDPDLSARLEETLAVNLADTTGAWALGADGGWTRVTPGDSAEGVSAQTEFQRLARSRIL